MKKSRNVKFLSFMEEKSIGYEILWLHKHAHKVWTESYEKKGI